MENINMVNKIKKYYLQVNANIRTNLWKQTKSKVDFQTNKELWYLLFVPIDDQLTKQTCDQIKFNLKYENI